MRSLVEVPGVIDMEWSAEYGIWQVLIRNSSWFVFHKWKRESPSDSFYKPASNPAEYTSNPDYVYNLSEGLRMRCPKLNKADKRIGFEENGKFVGYLPFIDTCVVEGMMSMWDE